MRRLIVFLIGLVLAVPASAAAASSKADQPVVPGRYLVVYQGSAGDVDAATDRRERARGFRARFRYRHAVRGFAAQLNEGQVRALRADPDVAYVVPDRPVHALASVQLAEGDLAPTGVRRIGAATTTTARQASTVGVAVVDTGIDLSHSDLNAKDATNCVTPGQPAQDDEGHGTHVAGTIGARNNGSGVVGVAPGTSVYAVKVLNGKGEGSWSQVICGLDWVAAHPSQVRVANLSLGGLGSNDNNCGNTDDDPLHQAVCRVTAAGVSLVVAAGNDSWDIGDDPPDVPSSYPEVLAVTAMSDSDGKAGASGPTCSKESDDTAATYSNFATRAADVAHLIAAPGTCIRSTYPGEEYAVASGTSMASPHVAGAVALCLGEGGTSGPCAGQTPAQIIQHMRSDAQSHTQADPSFGFTGDPSHPVDGKTYGYLLHVPALSTGGSASTTPTPAPAPATESSGDPAPATSTSSTGTTTAPTGTARSAPQDLIAPVVSISTLSQRLGTVLRRGLRVPLRCSERCTITARLVLDGRTARRLRLSRGKAVTIGTATVTLVANRTTTVTLRLTTAARRRLAGVRSLTASLRTSARDGAGNVRALTRRITLRR